MRFDENFKALFIVTASAVATALVVGSAVTAGASGPQAVTQASRTTDQTQRPAVTPVKVTTVSTTPFAEKAPEKSENKKNQPFECRNKLARTLYKAGFRGHNIREAWAIAMRESNGQASQVSNGVDHGLFQFNYPAWGGESWWNTSLLLTADYNAKIAYRLSDGGRNWGPWGMRDHAEWNFASYGSWSDWQIQNWIIGPYMNYYGQFPCK